MILNCANCGAPIEREKEACPYCKTPYKSHKNEGSSRFICTCSHDCGKNPIHCLDAIECSTFADAGNGIIRFIAGLDCEYV